MTAQRNIRFYHAAHSRSLSVLILLEELAAPYELTLIDMKGGAQREPAYLAVNPMGKVPAIMAGDALVSEQVAIYIYLADRYGLGGLAPALDDPARGPYLRWLVYYAACFEPAVVDKAMKRDPAPLAMCPYGDYQTMFETLIGQLSQGPYILGDRFSAADLLWATALTWMTSFKIVPDLPVIMDYIARVNARPAVIKARARDEEWAAGSAF